MVIQCTSGTNGGITTGLMLKVLTEKLTWQMVHWHHLLWTCTNCWDFKGAKTAQHTFYRHKYSTTVWVGESIHNFGITQKANFVNGFFWEVKMLGLSGEITSVLFWSWGFVFVFVFVFLDILCFVWATPPFLGCKRQVYSILALALCSNLLISSPVDRGVHAWKKPVINSPKSIRHPYHWQQSTGKSQHS